MFQKVDLSKYRLHFQESLEDERGAATTIAIRNILEERQSKFQKIEVFDTVPFGKMLVHDGVIMLTQYDNFAYHEMIVHVPMMAHPNPKRVLVVGGGDGGTLKEVLKHSSVEEAVLCEIDGDVIDVARKHFPELAQSFDDPRATVVVDDAAEYIKNKKGYFDVICVDSSDPIGPAEVLFRKAFYQSLHEALADDGIAVTQSESMYYHRDLIAQLYEQNKPIFAHASYYYALVPTYPSGTIGFSFCSKKYTADENLDVKRFEALNNLQYYTLDIHKASFKLPAFMKAKLV